MLGGVYQFSEFHQAQKESMAKGFVGKLVVVPDAKWDKVGSPHEQKFANSPYKKAKLA